MSGEGWGRGYYRVLLRLFPARFRERRGAAMERLFGEMVAERSRERGGPGPGFWVRLTWDTVWHALRERAASVRRAWVGIDSERGTRMGAVWSDGRYAVRALAKRPGYALMVVLMMTLGIAGNAAIFRVINGLFLRPLPFAQAERLVDVDETAPQWNLEFVGVAYADLAAWREGNETFEALGAFSGGGANFADESRAIRVDVVRATHDLDDVLRIEPALGRFFTVEEDAPDGARVVLLTDGFWHRQFGGEEEVLGRTVMLNGRAWEVIGVLPPAADFVGDADVWMALRDDPESGSGWYASGVGRLKPGVSLEQAQADLTAVHRGRVEEREVNAITAPVVHSLRDRYLGEYRVGSGVLLGAVAIVLLIACANIAGLMLARSLDRTREFGIRVAMGASGGRVARQLLVESLLLAGVGALLGGLLGFKGSSALIASLADEFPRWVTFDLDWRFVGFTTLITVGSAVLFGLAPAVRMSGVDPAGVLQASTARSTATSGRRRVMSLLVAGEVALALVLLVVAGLSLRDLEQLREVDPGFATETVLSYRVGLPAAGYEDAEQRAAFVDAYLDRLRSLPGVEGAAAASTLPLTGHWGWFYEAEGAEPRGEDESNPVVLTRSVTPGYLRTMGVRLVAGRGFDAFDGRDEGSRAVIVNESFVREFFGHVDDPVGKRIRTGENSPWLTVVGVTADVKHYGVDEDMRPGVYQPYRQLAVNGMLIAVRTAGRPAALMASARSALRAIDPQIATYDIATMGQRLDDSLFARRASSWLIAVFSTVALLLAVAGTYGVISYGVGQRVHEIGIRMALGADRAAVVRRVLLQGMGVVVVGVILGLLGAVLAAPLVAGMLVDVSPRDPAIYGVVTLIVLGVAALANGIPARRAARLEPMDVLRGE